MPVSGSEIRYCFKGRISGCALFLLGVSFLSGIDGLSPAYAGPEAFYDGAWRRETDAPDQCAEYSIRMTLHEAPHYLEMFRPTPMGRVPLGAWEVRMATRDQLTLAGHNYLPTRSSLFKEWDAELYLWPSPDGRICLGPSPAGIADEACEWLLPCDVPMPSAMLRGDD